MLVGSKGGKELSDFGKSYVPLVARDIETYLLFEKKEGNTYCIGSSSKDRYIEVPESIVEPVETAIKLCNGKLTIKEIEKSLIENSGYDMEVGSLVETLAKSGLLDNEIDEKLIEKQEFDKYFFKALSIPLTWTYKLMDKVSDNLLTKVVRVCWLIIAIGTIMTAYNWEKIVMSSTYAVGDSYVLGVGVLVFMLLLSIILHESSHAIMAYRFGLHPERLVIGVYMTLSPMLYLRIPGLYTISEKNRIKVWSAGVFINAVLGSLAIIIGSIMPSSDLQNVFILTAISNLGLVVANLSPLLPLDGYYIMSTLLKKANIRKGAFKEFKKWILFKSNKFRGIYLIYFMLTSSFMLFIFITQLNAGRTWLINSYDKYGTMTEIFMNTPLLQLALLLIIVKVLMSIVTKAYSYRRNYESKYNIRNC